MLNTKLPKSWLYLFPFQSHDWSYDGTIKESRTDDLKMRDFHIFGTLYLALTKTQQHNAISQKSSKTAAEKTLTESTAFLSCTTMNSIQTLAYSRATSPPHKGLTACRCWGKRLERLCAIQKQESLPEWTMFPLSHLRVEVWQQQQSWQWCARRSGRRRNGQRSGHNRSSFLYHKKASSNVRTILPST